MALPRIFIRDNLSTGQQLHLGDDRARYVSRALRLRVGDSISVFNGDDGEFSASVVTVSKDTVVVQVGSAVATATESDLKLHLVQGISRGERMDFVVQKATELGVKRISPVLTEYGVVKFDAARAAKRRDHWQSVAESACEQSGRTRPPLIDAPLGLNAWFGGRSKEADTDLILRPDASQALASVEAPSTKLCLLIGPEGGFSAREYDDAEVAGFAAVSLGPRILRTETAALAALTIAQTLWGDLR
jgi:16S rRNA (uracil1498-N3)-methyltransferase